MNNTFTLPSTFNKDNVQHELNKIAQSSNVDCAMVSAIDSAGIAALLYLKIEKKCHIQNITQKIISLCNLYQINCFEQK